MSNNGGGLMAEQEALFPRTIHHPAPPSQRFDITVRGKKVSVKYSPDWAGRTEFPNSEREPYSVQHIEFRTKSPGPISPTGYRSQFINGTREQLGITSKNVRTKIRQLAETLADEYEKEHGGKK